MWKAFAAVVILGALALGQGVVLVDQAGREVLIPPNPIRVASVFGVATPYVYALGAGDRLVGARYLGLPDLPLARQVMARIDPAWEKKAFPAEVGVETLVALRAQLVLGGIRHRALADLLIEVRIPSLLLAPETFDGVRQATLLTARALGKEDTARELLEFYDALLAKTAEATRDIPVEARPRVLFVGTERLRVASGAMYQSQLIALAGAVSTTEGLPGHWQNVNLEQVLIWNPEVILIAPYGPVMPEHILNDPDWQSIRAVKEKRVYKMPQLLMPWDTPVPESAVGILWMAGLLHPGRIGLDLAQVIQEFYTRFYGCPLEPEELTVLLGK